MRARACMFVSLFKIFLYLFIIVFGIEKPSHIKGFREETMRKCLSNYVKKSVIYENLSVFMRILLTYHSFGDIIFQKAVIDMQVKENTSIVQSNFLLENRPKLTKDETRLFITIIGAINKDDEDFKQLEIPVKEFAELWGVESNAAYRKIKAALRGLVQKEFYIEGTNQKTGKTRFLSMSYISMATYEEGEGYATVEVSQMFKPYLLALKKNYTRYVLENILTLSTVNSIRNYELLKQYETLGVRTFSIEDYKRVLGIEKKYALNADLKRYVLDAAEKEINQNTDIQISHEFVGRGKKASIVFTIAPNDRKKTLLASDTQNEGSGVPKENKDFTVNPLSRTFEDKTAELDYIDRYLEGTFEHEFCRTLVDTIPVDVHGYEEAKILAIRSTVVEYLPPYTMPGEKELWIMKTLTRFNVRKWEPELAANVKFSAYSYYMDGLERWLAANFGQSDTPETTHSSFEGDEFIDAALQRGFE